MKKILLSAVLLFGASLSHAIESEPQMRIWRSSQMAATSMASVLFSSEPILFCTVIGSPTVGVGDGSYFSMIKSTNFIMSSNLNDASISTKAFVPLDTTAGAASYFGRCNPIYSSSYTFINKIGASIINVLWDYYRTPPNFTTNGDGQTLYKAR